MFILWKIKIAHSEYGLSLEYLNLKRNGKSKVRGILWRPEIRAGFDKYAANESLYLLQNVIKPQTNSKKSILKPETEGTVYIIAR